MEMSTALFLLAWAVVIGVLHGPMSNAAARPTRVTQASRASQTNADSTTIWTRGKEFIQTYAHVEYGIATKCRIQIQQSLSKVKETCRACTAAAKSHMTFAVSVVTHLLTTRVVSTNNAHSLLRSKKNRVQRLAPVCMVALLYMMFQQQGHYLKSSMTDSNQATMGTLWSTNVYTDHSIISPDAVMTASRHSPIGLAYVTQQLMTLDQDASIEQKRKKKKKQKTRMEKKASVVKKEPIVEPALEPTFQFRSDGSQLV